MSLMVLMMMLMSTLMSLALVLMVMVAMASLDDEADDDVLGFETVGFHVNIANVVFDLDVMLLLIMMIMLMSEWDGCRTKGEERQGVNSEATI